MITDFVSIVEVLGDGQRFPLKNKIQGKYEKGIVEQCTGMARATILLVGWPRTSVSMIVKFGESFKGHLTKNHRLLKAEKRGPSANNRS